MPIPTAILDLVSRFDLNRSAYHAGQYNEAQVRQEFINPFWAALGWDVYNAQGYSEKYKEVVHEDAIKIGEESKAPDYAFRLGGQRVFFVEAKKPAVHIKTDISPAYQLRRYAWSAKLPLSVLTDFEEFAIYDCRIKPVKTDQAAVARVMYFTYQDYADRWDEIAALFSPEAIRKGAFDRYAESNKAKKGTAEVDAAFLAEIEGWRDALARNIALRNPGLGVRELNRAVQMTIDRLIFLRICEDRGIEPYGRLHDAATTAPAGQVYAQLGYLFQQADDRYNSGLFHFRQEKDRDEAPDDFTLNLSIDDKTLKPIVAGLYYPDCPYEFSVLPADILGQVYEQFLGKVIRLTAGGQARVEEKPEVKKAGGVYYTPTYIVDYIVEHTVGKLLEGKTPRQVWGSERTAPLRVLDPACGSGTFLLQAYQVLLDWYLEQYVADDPQTHARQGRIVSSHALTPTPLPLCGRGIKGEGEGKGCDWALTPEERKRILLAHIYGVDIDPQAVEVTKLSLLLKVLEGEVAGAQQLSFAQERALPDLDRNIRCGNSLIGPDYYQGQQLALFDEEEMYRVNAFDWKEGFPQAWAAGGFDAVIGNPPYIRIQALKEWAPQEVEFYKQKYVSASKGNYDIYVVFVEKGLGLLKREGRLGYILPHKFFNAQYGEPLRGLIAQGKHLADIVHFGDQQVFANATTYTCLLFLDKAGNDEFGMNKVEDLESWQAEQKAIKGIVKAQEASAGEWNFVIGKAAALFDKLRQVPCSLGDVAGRIAQGVRTSANQIYVLDYVSGDDDLVVAYSESLDCEVTLEKRSISQFLQGREIKPYQILHSGKIVIMPYALVSQNASLVPENALKETCPNTYQYLRQNKAFLEEREHGRFRGTEWYVYGRKQNIEIMLMKKILVPDIANRASFALDENGEYAFTSGYAITLKAGVSESIKYILGLLNSRVLDFYLKQISTTLRGGFFRYFTQYIEQLPIRVIDFANPADVAHHDQIVALVESMLDLHRKLAGAKTPQSKRLLQQQIDLTDRQIDALVYELYGLTEEEIEIVEGV